jgi:hypothetical protein
MLVIRRSDVTDVETIATFVTRARRPHARLPSTESGKRPPRSLPPLVKQSGAASVAFEFMLDDREHPRVQRHSRDGIEQLSEQPGSTAASRVAGKSMCCR